MSYIDCVALASFLQNLELPPLTQDEENQLMEDEQAKQETLVVII